jgi:hypothetical protein
MNPAEHTPWRLNLLDDPANDRFVAMMDKHLPQWRTRRQELNAAPLPHDDWVY